MELEKIIVNLKQKRIVFFDLDNLPLDDGEEYTELPYALPKGIKMSEQENENTFKEIMEDYNKRYSDKDMGLMIARPFKLLSKGENREVLKKRLRDKIKDCESKRKSNCII